MPPKIELLGRIFGRLKVVSLSNRKGENGGVYWKCICSCGKTTIVRSDSLVGGIVKSCNCLQKETVSNLFKKHGMYKSKIYECWENMKYRCENPKATGFKYWGGRGIKVCSEWHDFIGFKNWALSHGYQNNLTLDRINNDENYEPTNCRWVTKTQQNQNKR